jgi:zinc transport system ATP-binding protein
VAKTEIPVGELHGAAEAHSHVCPDCASAPADRSNSLISARGLHIRRGERDLLSGVDLDVGPGEIVTLIGPNGAGKTTLVKVLLGIEKPDGGSVTRRANIVVGYVPQRFDIDVTIPITVETFLGLGGRPSRQAITDVLGEVGALRTQHQQLSKLSGGETQRVLMARALLRRPDLLILDEPTRGVDFTGEAELYELIGRLRDRRGLGILLVSHDLHVVMAASDRVLCLNGHICCSGKPEDVSQHPEYARIFGAPAGSALGVYHHHHDHAHDLKGRTMPLSAPDERGS